MKTRLYQCMGSPFAPLTVACILQLFSGCERDRGSIPRQQIVGTPEPKSVVAEVAPAPHRCPSVGSHRVVEVTGHHKVILSWTASRGEDVAGYCLYRSSRPNVANEDARKEFRCTGCEQINSDPVLRTGCVDNLVHDGFTYFYVATAMNHGGTLSIASNETRVDIPETPTLKPGNMNPSSYPSCQDSLGSK